MVFNNDYYKQIINDYPEYVNKEQFFKIAHISKRTAQYLLQSKKVPCTESGKKTRKYKIKVSDIIAYLTDREIRPRYYLPSCSDKINLTTKSYLHSKMYSLTEEEKNMLRYYLMNELVTLDDVLTIKDISVHLGLSREMISRRCTKGEMFSFIIKGKRIIPKTCLIDYIASEKGVLLIGKSPKYDVLLEGFLKNKCYSKLL